MTQRFSATWRAVVLAVVAGGTVAASPLAWGRALDLKGDDWEGMAELVRLAQAEVGANRVVTAPEIDLAELGPDDAIVLVHPERAIPAEELSAFMRSGGRIVLLDDYGTGDVLLAHFRIKRVPLPAHPAQVLRHNPALAIAEPASEHAAVRDVERVVTNHATGLTDTGLLPLLVVHGRDEPDVLLAVAGVVGRGRFLAVGDASVVMNAMLRFPGNHALARAIIRYAADDTGAGDAPAAEGHGRVFLLANDGTFRGHYAGDQAGPLGDLHRAMLEALGALRRGVSPLLAYVFALLVGVFVVLWATRRAGRTHRPAAPRFVRPIALADQGGFAGHAAVLRAADAPVAVVAAELKNGVEEQVAAWLGHDRPYASSALIAEAAARGLLEPEGARALAKLLEDLSRLDPAYPPGVRAEHEGGVRRVLARGRRARLSALARAARDLLTAMDRARRARHDKVAPPT